MISTLNDIHLLMMDQSTDLLLLNEGNKINFRRPTLGWTKHYGCSKCRPRQYRSPIVSAILTSSRNEPEKRPCQPVGPAATVSWKTLHCTFTRMRAATAPLVLPAYTVLGFMAARLIQAGENTRSNFSRQTRLRGVIHSPRRLRWTKRGQFDPLEYVVI